MLKVHILTGIFQNPSRLLLLNKLLEDGNILYRKNRVQEAAHRYQYALRKIPPHSTFAEHSGTFLQLKVNFLLNHSRCKRKTNVSHNAGLAEFKDAVLNFSLGDQPQHEYN